jgi:hypothetical protein
VPAVGERDKQEAFTPGYFAMQSQAMVDADPFGVDDLQTVVRADRRASSIPLFAAGAGALTVGFVNAGDIRGGPFSPFGWGWMLLPMVVFATAWGVVFLRSRRLGLGTGHDGYGLMPGGLATTILLLPLTLFVGALGVVGAGLVFLGLRLRDPWLRGVGVAFLILGISSRLYNLAQLVSVGLDGRITWGDAVTRWSLGSISLAAAVLVWRRERRLAR